MAKTKQNLKQIADSLNAIPWLQVDMITPDAEPLIQEHLTRIRTVIEALHKTKGLNPTDAYSEAQSAGYDAPGYKSFMEMLFQRVEFRGARVRNPLILTIISYYFWDHDSDLKMLLNPWEPLMKLYHMGYTSTFDEDVDGQHLDLLIGFRDQEKRYKIV